MRVMLLGDTHGHLGWWKTAIRKAKQYNCEAILQLGDFGQWEHYPQGRAYVDGVSRLVTKAGLEAYWLDGNHDNVQFQRDHYEADADGFVPMRPNLYYLPRGHRWEWDGLSFLALGGAYSIDKEWRLHEEEEAGVTRAIWWPEELITAEEAELAKAGGHADIMVTHDCPAGVDVLGSHHSEDDLYFPQSEANRARLRDVVDVVRPTLLAHGHYHVRHSGVIDLPYESAGELAWHRIYVEGFANEDTWERSWGILDTEALKHRVLSELTT